MITPQVIREVKRLLEAGQMSQREIARRTGVSRATVGSVAMGRRPDYEQLEQERAAQHWRPQGPPRRCPGCGGLVYLPCRLCRLREETTRHRERKKRLARLLRGDVW